MKTLIIALIAVFSISATKLIDTETINATYNGYDNYVYSFTDDKDNVLEFQYITDKAMNKFDLKNEKFIGQIFEITYEFIDETIDMEDDKEHGDMEKSEWFVETETLRILDLELIN